jgi:hypothetical protein
MRRGEAWKPLRERGGWMRLSERAVFLALLERSDNADCSIPVQWAPSVAQLAGMCCCSASTVKLALGHLERHKWLIRDSKPNAGRGHKASYRLADGVLCDCPPDAKKRADSRPFYDEKRADSRPSKRADSHRENSRSAAVSNGGHRREKVQEGTAVNWPAVRIPGVSGPIPDDPRTRRALHTITSLLGPVKVIEIL